MGPEETVLGVGDMHLSLHRPTVFIDETSDGLACPVVALGSWLWACLVGRNHLLQLNGLPGLFRR